jgi:glycosyltransferase involved in cell wall biosynthesis
VTHLILIPSYNTGPKLFETVGAARAHGLPVWVVIDGSTDGTAEELSAMKSDDKFRLIVLQTNCGKGAAVLAGLRLAEAEGFTHALTMDADGQHPAASIPAFIALSKANPGAMILGRPLFDSTAPWERVWFRKLANGLANLLGRNIGDCLCGFRVYPIGPLRRVMEETRWMRRFDFDPEAAIRLSGRGVPALNHDFPVRYFTPQEGGVSHFRYRRDNILLAGMYLRLMAGAVARQFFPLLSSRAACPPKL